MSAASRQPSHASRLVLSQAGKCPRRAREQTLSSRHLALQARNPRQPLLSLYEASLCMFVAAFCPPLMRTVAWTLCVSYVYLSHFSALLSPHVAAELALYGVGAIAFLRCGPSCFGVRQAFVSCMCCARALTVQGAGMPPLHCVHVLRMGCNNLCQYSAPACCGAVAVLLVACLAVVVSLASRLQGCIHMVCRV